MQDASRMPNEFWLAAQKAFQAEAYANEHTPPAPTPEWQAPSSAQTHAVMRTATSDLNANALQRRMNTTTSTWSPTKYRAVRRSFADVSDSDLASATGKNTFVVGGWNSGRISPGPMDINTIADVFNLPTDAFTEQV